MEQAISLLAALILDWSLGEPRRFHPLCGFGVVAGCIEKLFYNDDPSAISSPIMMRLRGCAALALTLAPFMLAIALLTALGRITMFVDVISLYFALGARSLTQHAAAVQAALEKGDLNEARRAVGMIVSRDTSAMSEDDIARAAVESVLENGNDAVFAPLFWFMLGGAPLAVLYRLANTLDAMWGYRNQRYLHFGWAAARFDDLLNPIPARLTALTYALTGNFRSAWNCWHKQAPLWYSPNAGPVMAAGAGSLEIILGGNACYGGELKTRPILGRGALCRRGDIERAGKMVTRGIWLWATVALLRGFLHGF